MIETGKRALVDPAGSLELNKTARHGVEPTCVMVPHGLILMGGSVEQQKDSCALLCENETGIDEGAFEQVVAIFIFLHDVL